MKRRAFFLSPLALIPERIRYTQAEICRIFHVNEQMMREAADTQLRAAR